MISRIEGMIVLKGNRFLVIDVGGVGYKVFVAPETLRAIPSDQGSIALWTHTHVKEDVLDLYGFPTFAEMSFFETLISVSGVGPKSALGILGVAPLDTLKRAIASGETIYLTKVSGIGKRVAEKIIVELRDKLGGDTMSDEVRETMQGDADVIDALLAMGYGQREAREVIQKIPADITETKKRLAEALKIMGKGQ
ncbi:MAG: Holliday junction branch migration protein RuvA [Candidatus Ryanbacteria bacterium CG10_big_fil_rev_8_21_14_0_10_43_42]|uniref:Holliday junction branch migration complex subunit RuvA n=1 Tax=Candidatus Ryanbacteria bacterium CG10_big_fil_rev_8_21_14_0_10_43_42 TaxID=1974864 RepID=A0A2M8KWE5_9BACT|nr:MAG: Holliday junction branch migration protein RuvA [Candidatus Ryanbacteria bacterium CG10_big_fil_rev_8_21_14_0_10_43_42]